MNALRLGKLRKEHIAGAIKCCYLLFGPQLAIVLINAS